jgi:hypothetical protein
MRLDCGIIQKQRRNMKSYFERLLNCTEDALKVIVSRQKAEIKIMERDLEMMEHALAEKQTEKQEKNWKEE